MAKLPAITLYNQDRASDIDFLANFVARRAQAEALLNSLRHIARGGPTEHQILIGARGMGKTSLLRRIAIGVGDDPDLCTKFIPLRFREEQYNVITLSDFWRNCGEALAEWCEQSGNQALADRLDIAVESPNWRDDDRARDAFLEACDEVGGRAILLLDNLDLILEGIKEVGNWKLRETLQRVNGPIVIGAATSLLAQGANRGAAFYEFFHPHILEPLTEHELLACLKSLASGRGKKGAPVRAVLSREPERVRALYVLTGGNPRILGLIYGLLEQANSAEIFADLENLLDQVTPFYKARIEEYGTSLQRAVIDGIALNWDPISSGDLSKQIGVPSTTLSAQLDRLRKDGLIEEVESSGSRAGFQMAERFLNIWYLMRHGTRKTKQRLRWFTIFLTKLFSAEELERMADEARLGVGRWRADHCEAVIEAYDLKMLTLAETPLPTRFPPEFLKSLSSIQKQVEEGRFPEALRNLELAAREMNADVPAMAQAVVTALKAVLLHAAGQHQDAITNFDFAIARVADRDEAETEALVSMALQTKGNALDALDRLNEALETYDQAIGRFSNSGERVVQRAVALSLTKKSETLAKLGRGEEALAVLEDLVARIERWPGDDLQWQVATAMRDTGRAFAKLDRHREAIAVYEQALGRFSDSDEENLQVLVGETLEEKGDALSTLDRSDEALAAYEEVVSRFGKSERAELREVVASALISKGSTLSESNRKEEALDAFEEAITRLGRTNELRLERLLATGLARQAIVLHELERNLEAIAACRELVARFGDSTDEVSLKRMVVLALVTMGLVLGETGHYLEALTSLDEAATRLNNVSGSGLRETVAQAIVETSKRLFWTAGYHPAAEASIQKLLQRDSDFVSAKVNLLWMLLALGRGLEARNLAKDLEIIQGGGRLLMHAGLNLAEDKLGPSLENLKGALEQGLDGEYDFNDDLLWYLRIAEERGLGEPIANWFLETGHAERYAPIYGAFVALVRGERTLLDLNPEVRGVARPLFERMSAGKKGSPDTPSVKKGARKTLH